MNSFRKVITLLTFIILFQGILFSQTQKNDTTKTKDDDNLRATNTIYFELGGNLFIYSLNYEKEISKNINARIGFSVFNIPEGNILQTNNEYIFATLMANYFLELDTDNYVELGAGVLYTGDKTEFTSTLGYRYSPINGGFVFKIALTPFVIERKMRLWFGIGIGYRF